MIMNIAQSEIILKLKQWAVENMNKGLEFQYEPESILMVRR